MEPWAIALSVLAAFVSGPCALLFGGWAVRRFGHAIPLPQASVGPPTLLPITPDDVIELRGELAGIRAEWKAHQKQLDAYLDAFEDLEESVERRRRRTAASRSKIEAAEQHANEEPPNPREAARMRARALGFKV